MSYRNIRVAEAIKREISDLLLREIKDSRIKNNFVSVTNVEVTNDLRHAKLYFSIIGNRNSKEEVIKGLESAKGFIRTKIGERINLRFVPDIQIKLDESLEKGAKLISLIDSLRTNK
ncbi:MAG: ribosome-binding factor A [Candidatus Sericytochromatia bacterium]|nr:MAG: ribosome-binding factor A [Candidatus Sericytochromatia bacterium]